MALIQTIHGKFVYLMRTTDSLTTKLNRLLQDLRLIDRAFSQWQSQLNVFPKSNTCHDSIMLEFLSKHSTAVNCAFVSLWHVAEIQDILQQFTSLEARTLFGFPHLASFLHSQILTCFSTDSTMLHTSRALDNGFPLFINPMVDIEHQGSHIEASVLLTLPEIPNEEAFCTIANLTPLKFNSSNICYTSAHEPFLFCFGLFSRFSCTLFNTCYKYSLNGSYAAICFPFKSCGIPLNCWCYNLLFMQFFSLQMLTLEPFQFLTWSHF